MMSKWTIYALGVLFLHIVLLEIFVYDIDVMHVVAYMIYMMMVWVSDAAPIVF